jgi:cell division septal protein FtsQ
VAAKRRTPGARVAGTERRRARTRRSVVARIAPSGRSLLVGFAILAVAAGAYAGARTTSVFAVTGVDVRGAPSPVERDVRAALRPVLGSSLVEVHRSQIEHRLAALPWVASWSYDRAFPHTLRIDVEPEQPLAIARRGADAWLVSARGRVLARAEADASPRLPRIWLAKNAAPVVNTPLGGSAVAAIDALAPAAGTPFLERVRFVRQGEETLTLVLRSGLEVRLGDVDEIRLKLEIARRILPALAPPGYLDLSVPERPVTSTNPQVEG